MRLPLPLVLLLAACGSTWTQKDVDGDGFTPAQGDCWDSLDVVPGTKLTGAQVHPNVAETWYDGVDQDCAGDDDYDADGDGWVPRGAYVGRATYGVARSGQGHKGGGDCWDAPASADIPDEFAVVSEELAGVAWTQPTAAEVHPGVAGGRDTANTGQLQDSWYDGVDQDCGEDDDFDADFDGWRTDAWPDATGALGEDCIDGSSADADNPSGADPFDVNPDAAELWYDGTDDDCDTASTVDCDFDGDGYRADPNFLLTPEESPCLFADDELLDCVDDDATVYPDPTVDEIPYNGVDDNCDTTDLDGDKDGDGAWAVDYLDVLAARGITHDDTVTVPDDPSDCWDDEDISPEDAGNGAELRVLDGFDALEPADVYRGADDRPYDGADQDCLDPDADSDGILDDFDWDLDGDEVEIWPSRDGATGGDCLDCPADCFDGSWEATTAQDWCDDLCAAQDANAAGLDPADIHTGATETWYDGTDADCDDISDDDADMDGEDHEAMGGTDCLEGTALDTDLNPAALDPALVNTAATEVWYDGTDADCDDASDDDADGDGYDHLAQGGTDCIEDTALDATPNDGGLDPADVYPGATDVWYDGTDADCSDTSDYDADRDGYDHEIGGGTDCLEGTAVDTDANPAALHPAAVHPGAVEVWYDGTDANCDDNDGDADGDGHVWADYAFTAVSGDPVDDCNDTAATTYPGATEIPGDEVDQDCDETEICYVDADGDGVRVDGATTVASDDLDCTDDGEGQLSDVAGDCDDGDETVAPGLSELCDGLDNDCDGTVPADELDGDDDDWVSCTVDTDGWDATAISGGDDCDDADETVYPSATELCDGVDNDCDGTIPDDENDLDSDGYVACTVDSGGWDGVGISGGEDCDDDDISIYPGAPETAADGIDQNCDGTEACYVDGDGDGYHDGATMVLSTDTDCDDPGEADASASSGECDDTDATINPGATEIAGDGVDQDCDGTETCYLDADDDGYRPDTTSTVASADTDCEDTTEALATDPSGDCEDSDAAINPGATEVCDALDVDEDCNGTAEEADPGLDESSASTWHVDSDVDGYGDESDTGTVSCDDPSGTITYRTNATDCDDSDAAVSPAATEVCDDDDVDEDCDGLADDDDTSVSVTGKTTWYADADTDGFGDVTVSSVSACDDPSGTTTYVADATDCDDDDTAVNPDATELTGDGVDQDCDGTETCYLDADDDGYRPDASSTVASADEDCNDTTEALSTAPTTDCDDSDAAINPGATEVCDAADVDEDCNELADEADPGLDESTASTWYPDTDVDGYGDDTDAGTVACDDPSGAITYLTDDTDCDDGDADINPDATEVCDASDVDEDCDGVADDDDSSVSSSGMTTWYADTDTDGYGDATAATVSACDDPSATTDYVEDATDCDDSETAVNPGATEICDNGVDDDCDGGPGECDVLGDIELLTSSQGRWLGMDAGDAAGTTVAALGEVMGSTTIGIGAPGVDGAGTNRGAAYLVTGVITGDVSLSTAVEISGAGDDHSVGRAMSVGDIDGDTQDDLLLGVLDEDSGVVYLLLGPVTASQDLSANDGTLYGSGSEDAGASLLGAGDLDNDGTGDLLVGAPSRSSATGAVYGILGPLTGDASVRTEAFVTFRGEAAGDEAGTSLANAGDTTGISQSSFLIGAWGNDAGGTDAGAAYLFTGPVSGVVVLSAADVIYTGTAADDGAGYAVSGVGDANGDGNDDMLIGGPFAGTFLDGTAWLVSGSTTASGTVSLSTAQATFTAEATGDLAGVTVEGAGDMDADGFDDLLIGAVDHDGAGAVYLVLGPVTGTIALGSADARLLGDSAGDAVGAGLAGLGDLDGNSHDDIVVGANGDGTAASGAGAASLILGGGL
jgi:hypothetical protein